MRILSRDGSDFCSQVNYCLKSVSDEEIIGSEKMRT